ncbi:MAG TPA: hypothetical protein VN661_05670 [Candidatus Acidoferrales bacterium]|nr:hypothetical protein [Candidatus Acidoferrales bacterium]
MKITKRTVAVSYFMCFMFGGAFFESLHANRGMAKGLLSLTVLVTFLSAQIEFRNRAIRVLLGAALYAAAGGLLFVYVRS